jgi:hypothetical protein
VPTDVREGIEFHYVEHMDDVFNIALHAKPAADTRRRPFRGRSPGSRTRRKEVRANEESRLPGEETD